MSASEETLSLLRRIAVAVEKLAASVPSGGGAVASDRDLDGRYGDPELRFSPRDWTGPNYKGRKFSQCPADLLDMVAETLEWAAGKAEEKGETTDKGKPVSQYKRADAARARGWAKRIRDGRHVQTTAPTSDFGSDDEFNAPVDTDIPF